MPVDRSLSPGANEGDLQKQKFNPGFLAKRALDFAESKTEMACSTLLGQTCEAQGSSRVYSDG